MAPPDSIRPDPARARPIMAAIMAEALDRAVDRAFGNLFDRVFIDAHRIDVDDVKRRIVNINNCLRIMAELISNTEAEAVEKTP